MQNQKDPLKGSSNAELNAHDLEKELLWFKGFLNRRITSYFQQQDALELNDEAIPDLSQSSSPYAEFVNSNSLNHAERVAIILSIIPEIQPHLLDVFFVKNAVYDRQFTEFGGQVNQQGAFIPTGETLAFVLGISVNGLAIDLRTRFDVEALFDSEHIFFKHNVLRSTRSQNDSMFTSRLQLSDEYLSRFTTGRPYRPEFSLSFPAQRIETELTWDDLVLQPGTRHEIEEIKDWLKHGEALNEWELDQKFFPGYRSLFYGPPGTDKNLTAALLGKDTGRDVYRIDLSLVVSKYIGETEKNLANIFDQAQHKGWILFFDEADALFGKRRMTRTSNDRHANQQISFLLQRIETFAGVVILSMNQRDDVNEAFARRFQQIVYFPMPGPKERLRLWQQGFPPKMRLEETVDLAGIAQDYELSPSSIRNAIRFVALQTAKRGTDEILADDILDAIKREHDRQAG